MEAGNFNRLLKVVIGVACVFMFASSLLYLTVQHVTQLRLQTNASNTQAAALSALVTISEERLEVNKEIRDNQTPMMESLQRIERKLERLP